MNKLYYDNAIDALYMSERFGVEFYREYKDESAAYYDKQDLIDEIGTIDIKLYVIPESMSIFEPKEGDFITQDGDSFCHKVIGFGKSKQPICSQTKIEYEPYWDKIIQRNNKPFIMPKQENDNE